MKGYPNYISAKRRPNKTPKSIVKNGKVQYGTFNKPFEEINLLDAEMPCEIKLPQWLKKLRFVEWEAFEISMDEGILISAVYRMFPVSFSCIWWFDKNTQKVQRWRNIKGFNSGHVASQLVDDDSYLKTKHSDFKIHNRFLDGIASCKGYAENKNGIFEIDIQVERMSPPANGVMPLNYNKKTSEFCNPLYSEKDFFKARGTITVNGEIYKANTNTVAIIDDHKGFYPYRANYDWLTTMGKCNIDGAMKYLAFNLTRNQSVEQNDYNENVLWIEKKSYPLPPVRFEHKSIEKGTEVWYVKDEYGDVDIKFEIHDTSYMKIKAGIISVDYALTFGKIYGYVKNHDGKKYIVDGMDGIGEDKSTKL